MTRKDSVRAATSTAKDSVRHAAEVMAPYAGTAKDTAVHYAHEARSRLAPKVAEAAHQAAHQARCQYDAHLHPRIEHARGALPPKIDQAAVRARTAVEPVRDEAVARSAAAFAALRGQVSPQEIEKLIARRDRRCRAGRAFRRLALVGLIAGGAYAAWKWWDRQANPDWLVEPPEATEVHDRPPLSSVDGTGPAESSSPLDPEVQAKQAEAESPENGGTDDRPF
ncbi:transcriptional regulator [Streptomyces rectiverticillatus]|uniref:DUF5324 family protein n=1 Tax=Streptomyces rectiverticillatus TaxID=173860 RepID=UPI0015C3B31F|nr:DUF5324 family protein [Streptomyces rectiverticillatus]QLE72972.1 transcriptional regulator [Streptomyces rectiverticillatus]